MYIGKGQEKPPCQAAFRVAKLYEGRAPSLEASFPAWRPPGFDAGAACGYMCTVALHWCHYRGEEPPGSLTIHRILRPNHLYDSALARKGCRIDE